jgi:hypothetical protein
MLNRSIVFIIFLLLIIGCKFGSSDERNAENTQPVSAASTPDSSSASSNTAEAHAEATPTPAPNAVCPDPSKPCQHKEKHFDDWELSFKMPTKLKANKTNESAPFYGIIVKAYDPNADCDGGEYLDEAETERKQVQHKFPGRKVFASYGCPNMYAVSYDFEGRDNAKHETVVENFIAIYAGQTKEEATDLLNKLRPDYPKAQLKQMKASYEWIDQ